MEDAIKVLQALSDIYSIRILKLLSKKMLDSEQLSSILGIKEDDVNNYIIILSDTGVVKKVPGGEKPQYFAVSETSIFNRYAKDTVMMLNRWFNNHPDIISDFEKASKLKK